MADIFDLEGKTALVTGAGSGIGRALAVGLARAGARVVVTDMIDTAATLDEVIRAGNGAMGLHLDVSRKQDVQAMVERVSSEYGSLDILINNGGICVAGAAGEMMEQEMDRALGVNLKGQFLCAHTVGRLMMEQGSGKIINIAPTGGGSAACNASKAGLVLLTKSLAVEFARHNIQVNAICPVVSCAPTAAQNVKNVEFLETIRSKMPTSMYGGAGDVVSTAVYLSSAASGAMTGHALVIEGGRAYDARVSPSQPSRTKRETRRIRFIHQPKAGGV